MKCVFSVGLQLGPISKLRMPYRNLTPGYLENFQGKICNFQGTFHPLGIIFRRNTLDCFPYFKIFLIDKDYIS